MNKQLFGTDGIRGVAGEPPLDPSTVFIIGKSLGEFLRPGAEGPAGMEPHVAIGEDTRESSHWIAETLAAGLQDAGVSVHSAGVITTPGLACVTAAERFAAGVMISASHNPFQDNGIKVFGGDGFKLPDADELQVEQRIIAARDANPANPAKAPSAARAALGSEPPPMMPRRHPLQRDGSLHSRYVNFLRERAAGIRAHPAGKVVLDCANGSAAIVSREVFQDGGPQWIWIADAPDGRNINLHCGSLHLDNLRRSVLEHSASLGIAFDGDADRALFVGGSGQVINGDGILLAAGRYLLKRGLLRGGAVVGTTMSNLGLERALAQQGLGLLRTPVGDKYVLEEMLRSGCNLGGEQSGHIIFRDLATTGDGLLTAIEMLRIISEERKTLEELVEGLEEFPQAILNVRVRHKLPLQELPAVMEQIRASEQSLGAAGRVVVRYSGTEPLARVMVEAHTPELVEHHTAAIAGAIQKAIGA